jgi:hypothetical protein
MASMSSGQLMAFLVSSRTLTAAFRALSFFGVAAAATFWTRGGLALVAFFLSGGFWEVFVAVMAGLLWVEWCGSPACPLRLFRGTANGRVVGADSPGAALTPASRMVGDSLGTFFLGLFFADMSCLRWLGKTWGNATVATPVKDRTVTSPAP